MNENIRPYQEEKDKEAAYRIWQECGWIDDSPSDKNAMDIFMEGARGWVYEFRGEAECLVVTEDATIRYLDDDLAYGVVGAVTTSRIARNQGMGSKLTAHALADLADRGATAVALGMFDQGYYDRLGFGTGAYDHCINVSPGSLRVPRAKRAPYRLCKDKHWEQILANRLNRRRSHGNVNLPRPGWVREEMEASPNGFGLGFFDNPDGTLSHHVWIQAGNVEHGPYRVNWLTYQTPEQMLELLGVIKNLGDQVDILSCWEFDDVPLQHFIHKPFKSIRQTKGATHPQRMVSEAGWQIRILDPVACIEAMAPAIRSEVHMNVRLTDPISGLFEEGASGWTGCGGSYWVEMRPGACVVGRGEREGLPVLEASVNAFSRFWIGVCSAWALSVDGALTAPVELIDALDRAIILPEPKVGWSL